MNESSKKNNVSINYDKMLHIKHLKLTKMFTYNFYNIQFYDAYLSSAEPSDKLFASYERLMHNDGTIYIVNKHKSLEVIDLSNSNIINIDEFRKFHKLKILDLSHTNIFDISVLRELKQLVVLDLSYTIDKQHE